MNAVMSPPPCEGADGPEDPLAIFAESAASRYAWIAPLGSFISGPVLPEAAHNRTLEELASSVCRSGASLLGT